MSQSDNTLDKKLTFSYNVFVVMKDLDKTEQLRTIVVDRILTSIAATTHTEHALLELRAILQKEPDIHKDIPLLQSATLLDFLAKQIHNGNNDIVTQEVIAEVYSYILDKLTYDIKSRYNN